MNLAGIVSKDYVQTQSFKFKFEKQINDVAKNQANKIIQGKCQEIFTAIGNGDATTLAHLLEDPQADANRVATLTKVRAAVTLNSKRVRLSPLSAAALIGCQQMIHILLAKTSNFLLCQHVQEPFSYESSCHTIILQRIEDSENFELIQTAYQKIARFKSNSKNQEQRLQQLATIYQNLFIKIDAKMVLVAPHVPVKPLQVLIKEYLVPSQKALLTR